MLRILRSSYIYIIAINCLQLFRLVLWRNSEGRANEPGNEWLAMYTQATNEHCDIPVIVVDPCLCAQ